jgi:hypothetical protein
MRWLSLLVAASLAGCPPPAQYRIVRPDLSCERATRVAYRTLVSLGYSVSELVAASPERAGKIAGSRPGPEGRPINVGVLITCGAGGAVLQPIEPDLIPNWEYSRAFGYAFKNLVQLSEEDLAVPRAETGLEVLVHAIGPQEAVLDLGGVATVGGAVPVRVTVRNNTERSVRVEPARIDLVATDGSLAAALTGAALDRALAAGPAGDRIRREPLTAGPVGGHTTASGYLVYPPGTYREARIAIEDVETGETEGFVAPLR